LYGLISFSVAQRTREIGVRMALGAAPASVRRMVLRQGATLILTGLVVGGLAALAAVRLLGSLLHGVRPYDPASFTGAALVIAVAALLASCLPASRASTVDPLVALRSE
jgi:ABC-type antimicrobial peptide transport system permease subunit